MKLADHVSARHERGTANRPDTDQSAEKDGSRRSSLGRAALGAVSPIDPSKEPSASLPLSRAMFGAPSSEKVARALEVSSSPPRE
jgi:hypothetical protein